MTKITIDSTSAEFKPQFAAYFNMALYNFWNVIEHVSCIFPKSTRSIF